MFKNNETASDKPKSVNKQLQEKLFYQRKSAWLSLESNNEAVVELLCNNYRKFLSVNKTVRETARAIEAMLKSNDYVAYTAKGTSKKLYWMNRGRAVAAVKIGKKPIYEGIKIIMSHIDAPAIDLKQNPLYEDADLVLGKTHYYGGIKKYQWVTRPLALHAHFILVDGTVLDVVWGENENEPCFCISDLLPHLAGKVQEEKKLGEAIPAEKLNVVLGSRPINDEEIKEPIKLAILKHLYDTYHLTESDFLTAECHLVPAGPARDVGIDASLMGGYGQDDRVCAFTSLQALIDSTDAGDQTVLFMAVDKEEIGSYGNTGAKSLFIKQVVADLLEATGQIQSTFLVEKTLFHSQALSADVNGAIDSDWKEVHDERNAAKVGHGLCITKFTGSRGKRDSSEASSEFMAYLRQLFDLHHIAWQTGELGKVDEGGGGTIAKYIAEYGMDVIDVGPGLLAMHSPFELVSKIDIYHTYRAFKVFFEN